VAVTSDLFALRWPVTFEGTKGRRQTDVSRSDKLTVDGIPQVPGVVLHGIARVGKLSFVA
jgi:hypothetical protein